MKNKLLLSAFFCVCFSASALAEKHRVMIAIVVFQESAVPKYGSALAVRIHKRTFYSYNECQKFVTNWNKKIKTATSFPSNLSYKWQAVCYKKNATTLIDVTLDICGKSDLLYRRVCGFLVHEKPILEKYKKGERVRFSARHY